MNENLEFEYTVTKKVEGKYLLQRILMVIGYAVFAGVFFFGLFLAHLYPLMAFVILVEWIVIFFTWRYVSIEYRYETISGGIKFFTIYGGRTKKEILSLRIKDFDEIGRLNDSIDTNSFDKKYSFISSEKCSDIYYATFFEDGKRCIVLFEAIDRSLKILKCYNLNTCF